MHVWSEALGILPAPTMRSLGGAVAFAMIVVAVCGFFRVFVHMGCAWDERKRLRCEDDDTRAAVRARIARHGR